MIEEQIKKQVAFLEKCVDLIVVEEDLDSLEQSMEELYFSLYDIEKHIIDIITELSLPLLSRFVQALDMLQINQDILSGEIQEELDMIFYYYNIKEKIENQREISWDDLINS